MNNQYLNKIYQELELKNGHEVEFLQAVKEFFYGIEKYLLKNNEIEKQGIIERLVAPNRIITFQVPWVDDFGKVCVNTGYRVQFNNAIGPYKGGLRFHPSVNQSIMKFLGFEQTFKNSLTGLALGGAKGGSDFDPKNKSDQEIYRFCQSFMMELYRHIGHNVDIPAGDIGVTAKEIGYLYGTYKKITNEVTGVLTGKGLSYGGSLVRKEATGYGLCYFTLEGLKYYFNEDFNGKKVIVSGSGNVAIYTALKVVELGGIVVAMSDSNGYIYEPKGLDINHIVEIKENNKGRIKEYLNKYPKTIFNDSCFDIWQNPCDIALPCATQNELDLKSAQALIKNGCIAVCEGANMPSTIEAVNYFLENKIFYGPAKAANAGGVATSGIEMMQNSMRQSFSFDQVDNMLKDIMKEIFNNSLNAAKEMGNELDLVVGANVAAFKKISEAMLAQGV
ncbi:NADP-specific glutamate dehydrogenase [Acholeplasma sp. OttesenSCG-928-E16]|nr:NADP-specific glutamate dehydrogenase [Acholeplasma sp. OttesenSCG-928-E16]